MLLLNKDQLNHIVEAAQPTHPERNCGVLVGECDGQVWKVHQVFPTRNAVNGSKSEDFLMDTRDRIEAESQALKKNLMVIGFYSTRCGSKVEFSQSDLERTEEYALGEPWVPPAFAYLSVAIESPTQTDTGAFCIIDGQAQIFPLKIENV